MKGFTALARRLGTPVQVVYTANGGIWIGFGPEVRMKSSDPDSQILVYPPHVHGITPREGLEKFVSAIRGRELLWPGQELSDGMEGLRVPRSLTV